MDLMYNKVYNEMVSAGVASKYNPVWMDKQGNVVTRDQAFGQKCTHELVHPGMCLVGNGVGANTNMVEDGNKGCEKFIVPKITVPKLALGTKNSLFTAIILIFLTSKPVMCILILSGKKENPTHAIGIDPTKKFVGDVSNRYFFEKNFGKGKLFPGGSTCLTLERKSLASLDGARKEELLPKLSETYSQNLIPEDLCRKFLE